MDLKTGRIAWSKQTLPNDAYNSSCGAQVRGPNCPEDHGPDYDFGGSVILTQVGGKDMLFAGQKSVVTQPAAAPGSSAAPAPSVPNTQR